MSLGQLIGPELQTLLEDSPGEVRELLDDIHPEDIADIVEGMDDVAAHRALMELPTDYAAQVFERLEDDRQEALARQMGVQDLAEIAVEMDADDRADFYSVLPPPMQQRLLSQLELSDPEAAEDVQDLRRWEETTAGGLMTTDYLSVRPGMTMGDARKHIRELADGVETVDSIFVTTDDEKLVGLVTMRRMLLTPAETGVDEVMIHNVKSVPPELDQEEVARKIAKYDLATLPVVDGSGHLLGVITADDVLDVLNEEQSEDVHKMGAVEPIRDGYFETSYFLFLRKRAPWLVVLFLGGFLTTQTMQTFKHELATVTQLAFYLPLLISAGGNSGSQSSTLVIRGLAVGDIATLDWWRVLSREALQGATLGTLLAVLGVGRSWFFGDGPEFALLVGATIIAIVVLGCVIGALAPILLHWVGVDPATSSTPFIATVVDVMGILVYLTLAHVLLSSLGGGLAPG
jgi:magnesium transporter